jgi:hypothetical protein
MCEHVRGQRYGYGKLCYRILYSFWSLSPITTQLRYRSQKCSTDAIGVRGQEACGKDGGHPELLSGRQLGAGS